MKPYVICHMVASLDGRINSGKWSRSPDGDRKAWSALYEIHEALAGEAWLVGRVNHGGDGRRRAPSVGRSRVGCSPAPFRVRNPMRSRWTLAANCISGAPI